MTDNEREIYERFVSSGFTSLLRLYQTPPKPTELPVEGIRQLMSEPGTIRAVPKQDEAVDRTMLSVFKNAVSEWPAEKQQEFYVFMHDTLNCRMFK